MFLKVKIFKCMKDLGIWIGSTGNITHNSGKVYLNVGILHSSNGASKNVIFYWWSSTGIEAAKPIFTCDSDFKSQLQKKKITSPL